MSRAELPALSYASISKKRQSRVSRLVRADQASFTFSEKIKCRLTDC